MRRSIILLIITFVLNVAYAQIKVVEVTHYLFPQFTKGVVLMKNGVKNETMLNYNSLTEEMIFENNGTKLALGQPELVDTVYIKGRKFFLLNGKFVELINNSKYKLYAEHKCTVKDPGRPAAYGGTSQTSATTSYSSYFAGGQVYDLKLPEGHETKPFVDYWLVKDGEISKFLSIRQLSKLFGEKDNLFKEFVKKRDVKYTDQSGIIELIKYMAVN
jgi:hypothetical protein